MQDILQVLEESSSLHIGVLCSKLMATQVVQLVKSPPAMQETWVRSMGWEDLLEKEMATHCSVLAWRLPWTEESCDPMDCSPPLSLEFSRQEYWSGLPFPSPGDFPNPGIKPQSPVLQADSLLSERLGKPKTSTDAF